MLDLSMLKLKKKTKNFLHGKKYHKQSKKSTWKNTFDIYKEKMSLIHKAL